MYLLIKSEKLSEIASNLFNRPTTIHVSVMKYLNESPVETKKRLKRLKKEIENSSKEDGFSFDEEMLVINETVAIRSSEWGSLTKLIQPFEIIT